MCRDEPRVAVDGRARRAAPTDPGPVVEPARPVEVAPDACYRGDGEGRHASHEEGVVLDQLWQDFEWVLEHGIGEFGCCGRPEACERRGDASDPCFQPVPCCRQ